MKDVFGAVLLVISGIIGLTLLLGSWYTIDAGERGVILRNGAVVGVAQPGLGFKMPLVDSVQEISVQTQKLAYPKVQSYSKDQQPADIAISLNYRITPDSVTDVYSSFGSLEALDGRVIGPRMLSGLKNTFGQFNAERAIRERSLLNAEVQKSISESMPKYVIMEGVQIENIDFSDAFEKAVEERAQAEVEVAKFKQNAEREKVTAEITVTKAKAQADAVRAEAQAQADAIRLKGDADAAAIDAKGRALKANPALVDLVQAERWNGQLPTTMLPGGTIPMLTLPQKTAP